MARRGATTAIAFILTLAGFGVASARVLQCPSITIITGDASAEDKSQTTARVLAISRAEDAARLHAAALSCKPAAPPCSLSVTAIPSVNIGYVTGSGSWVHKVTWRLAAVCKQPAQATGGGAHMTMPPPGSSTSATAGGGSGAAGGAPPPARVTTPLVDCSCKQLATLLAELQGDEANAEAEERAIIGMIKSAQLQGEPTDALEAQLASNANNQASLRAWIKVVEAKLKRCPQACPPPGTDFALPPPELVEGQPAPREGEKAKNGGALKSIFGGLSVGVGVGVGETSGPARNGAQRHTSGQPHRTAPVPTRTPAQSPKPPPKPQTQPQTSAPQPGAQPLPPQYQAQPRPGPQQPPQPPPPPPSEGPTPGER